MAAAAAAEAEGRGRRREAAAQLLSDASFCSSSRPAGGEERRAAACAVHAPPPRKAVGPGCGRAFRRPPPLAAGSAPSPFSLSCSEPGREVGAASRRLIARLPPAGPGMKSGGTAIPSASARSRHDSNTAERRCGAALFLLPAGEAGWCRPGSRSAAWHRRGARRS